MQDNWPTLVSCKPLKAEFNHVQEIPITSENLTIGRGLSNNVVIAFVTISRNHCVLKKNEADWILEDHSSFGITVNRNKLGKGKQKILKHNDIIAFDSTHEFIYKFVCEDNELMPSSIKRIKLDPKSTDTTLISEMRNKFEESQNDAIKHIEDIIHNTKQITSTNILLKEQLQQDMERKINDLESNFASQIDNLKGETDDVEKQKALLIEKRDAQLAVLKEDMEGQILELMEQIKKHNEIETELIKENNLLKEKMVKEREDFLLELNRESSLKQDMLDKLEAKMVEQEEVRLKEKQVFEELLKKKTELLRLEKEKELHELSEQKKQRECELMEKLKNIKKNLQEQVEQTEKQRCEAQKQLNDQMEEMKKAKNEDKFKMKKLKREREEIQKKLTEAQKNSEKFIEELKSRVKEREVELAALAAERIQKQAEQSSEVISSLQKQLEKVRSQLQNVESENKKLLKNLEPANEDSSNSKLAEFGEIMESELQCGICAELFVTAMTLNCSHTFCKYCIHSWKKKKMECPICRSPITSECRSLVLDSFIEKMVQNLTEDMKIKRREMLKSREELESELTSRLNTSTSRRRESSAEESDVLSELSEDEEEESPDFDFFDYGSYDDIDEFYESDSDS